MQRSLIGPVVVAFGEVAGSAQTTIDGPWTIDFTPWQLIAAVNSSGIGLNVIAGEVLVVLALIGRAVPLDLLVRVSQLTDDATLDACEAAALTGLLVLLSRRASQTEASSFDLAARRVRSRRMRAHRHHSRFQRPGA